MGGNPMSYFVTPASPPSPAESEFLLVLNGARKTRFGTELLLGLALICIGSRRIIFATFKR